MQRLQLNSVVSCPPPPPAMHTSAIPSSASGNSEPKFYHYCYICNTQLNSCKQALLHCNGKRHKKKLQFLQTRKNTIGQMTGLTTATNGTATSTHVQPNLAGQLTPPPNWIYGTNGVPVGSYQTGSSPVAVHHHPVTNGAANGRMRFPSLPPSSSAHHPQFGGGFPAGLFPAQLPGGTPPSVLSPSVMAGTEHWLHPPPMPPPPPNFVGRPHEMKLGGGGPSGMLPMRFHPPTFIGDPMSHQHHPLPPQQHHSHSSSPLFVSDNAYSVVPFGTRGSVMSPSDTSSLSSDLSSTVAPFYPPSSSTAGVSGYCCHVCYRQYATGAQLHNHLQTAKHYKHHNHHFSSHSAVSANNGNAASGDGVNSSNGGGINRHSIRGDSSETDSTSSLHYCSVCSIAVNSHAQLQSHHLGQKHRQRSTVTKQRPSGAGGDESGSSSTSPEPTVDEENVGSKTDAVATETSDGDQDNGNNYKTVVTKSVGSATTVESGYASGSGDETIIRMIGRLDSTTNDDGDAASSTASSPISYKCRVCNVLLESSAQASQHLHSSKHLQRSNESRPHFRRKGSARTKKGITTQQSQLPSSNDTDELNTEDGVDDGSLTPSAALRDDDAESVITLKATDSL